MNMSYVITKQNMADAKPTICVFHLNFKICLTFGPKLKLDLGKCGMIQLTQNTMFKKSLANVVLHILLLIERYRYNIFQSQSGHSIRQKRKNKSKLAG